MTHVLHHAQSRECLTVEGENQADILLSAIKDFFGGLRGRVGKVAEFQRSGSFDHLTAVFGVGSSPALAACETSQVLLAGVSGGFPRVLPFRPTYRDWLVSMGEIILKGTLN